MKVGEKHNQPFRHSAGSALWGGGSPSGCAGEGPSKGRFHNNVLMPSWKFNVQSTSLGKTSLQGSSRPASCCVMLLPRLDGPGQAGGPMPMPNLWLSNGLPEMSS